MFRVIGPRPGVAVLDLLDLENEVSPTVAQPPGTLFLLTSTKLLTPVHSENDSSVYSMIVLTTDYCWRSWTCRIVAP